MATDAKKDTDSVAASIAAMKREADSLSQMAAGVKHKPADTADTPIGTTSSTATPSERYYDDLLERGELVNIDDTTELSELPPHVTHVRLPDGRVRRLGYS